MMLTTHASKQNVYYVASYDADPCQLEEIKTNSSLSIWIQDEQEEGEENAHEWLPWSFSSSSLFPSHYSI
jgi:hypothetical protein